MAAPVLKSFAQRTYDSVTPLAFDELNQGYDLANYCAALGQMFQVVEDYGRDQDIKPGWSQLLDINRCPPEALAWLGQFVGVSLIVGLTDAQLRARILAVGGWNRGTPLAIISVAQQFLTGTKTVIMRERDPAACAALPAYGLTVITRRSETPVEDWDSTNILLNGGFEVDTAGWNVSAGTLVRDATISRFGGASGKFTVSANGDYAYNATGVISGATAGRVYTDSIYVYALPSVVGKSVQISLTEFGGAAGAAGISNGFTLVAGWNRLTVTWTVAQNDRTGIQLLLQTTVGFVSGDVLYLDGAQVELQSTATPYIETVTAIASRPAGQGPVGTAIKAAKPAGIVLVYTILGGSDYTLLLADSPLYSNIFSNYATYSGVLTGVHGT